MDDELDRTLGAADPGAGLSEREATMLAQPRGLLGSRPMTETRKSGRPLVIAAVVVVAVIAVLALLREVSLAVFATEGDVPAASSIPLADGSDVVGQSVDCASGGCWILLSVRPPEGMTPDELSIELGTTPQAKIPGTLWDPRTITVSSASEGQLLVVRADYWSQDYIP